MDIIIASVYLLLILINSYWFMTSRFNNGLSRDLGLKPGAVDNIINSAGVVSFLGALISGWGVWLFPIYYFFIAKYVAGITTLLGIFILPQLVNYIFYHPKFFARKALKSLNAEREYNRKNYKDMGEVEAYFGAIENKLKNLLN